MFVVSGQPLLTELLASAQQIAHLWPAAASDVTSLIVMLVTAPSLGSLLTLKLVVLLTPSASALPAEIALAFGSIVLTAIALGADRSEVLRPHENLYDVRGLDVVDIAAGGLSAAGLAV